MSEIKFLRPPGLVASPAFSHVAVVPPGATMIYVGGQNAVDADGSIVGGSGCTYEAIGSSRSQRGIGVSGSGTPRRKSTPV